MKRFFSLVFLSCLAAVTLSQQIDSNWVAANYKKHEEMVPMRDGVKLFTTIYSPKSTAEKHPVLMMRTPYSVSPYGKGMFSPRLYTTHWAEYLKRGYIIVMQDVRGRYMSEGEFMDVRPFIKAKKGKQTDEASDTYDTADWLIKNVKGNNGNIGVFGISYPGFYATMAAVCGHPAVKAVSPQAPVTDWFVGDDFHHNGAFALHDGFRFYSGFGRKRPAPTTQHAKGFPMKNKDAYTFHQDHLTVANHTRLLGDSIAFWKELMEHPDYDDWWKARDARRACHNIKPAVLVVGGTFDAEDCFGAWNLYQAIEKQNPGISNKIVMGPWFHGGWHRGEGTHLGDVRFGDRTSIYYQGEIEVPFFEAHLRNNGTDESIAEATVFFSGENKWRKFPQWPSADIKPKSFYMHGDGGLSSEKPETENRSSYYADPRHPVPFSGNVPLQRDREYMISDQRFASRRPDVLVFSTPPLEDDIAVGGPLEAALFVKVPSGDADFVVKLIDVFPEDFVYDSSYCCDPGKKQKMMGGYQMLVRGEIIRGRYRNSLEKPEPFDPQKTEKVKFVLPDVAHTFRKGHRLMVQIQSSWFPLFDSNPQKYVDIYHCKESDFTPAMIELIHSPEYPSRIDLPVLPR